MVVAHGSNTRKGNSEKLLSVLEEGFPFVSIVICTYNRKKLLKDCLDSVFSADYPQSHYEILVIDGGSTDGTVDFCRNLPKVRLVVERKFGLAHARNKGANLARGSIVAYVDDDCIVDKDWLKNLVDGLRCSEFVVGIGGPVYPLHPEAIPKKIFVLAPLGFYDEGKAMKLVSGVVMPNSAFRRGIFETIQFDESLGVTKRGKLILFGEDTKFCENIIDAGHKLLYTPYSKVYHQIIPGRLTVRYIMKHAIGGGIITTKFILKRKKSRIWTVRIALGALVQRFFACFSDRSFTSCYRLVMAISTLLTSVTSIDEILVPSPEHLVNVSTNLQEILPYVLSEFSTAETNARCVAISSSTFPKESSILFQNQVE